MLLVLTAHAQSPDSVSLDRLFVIPDASGARVRSYLGVWSEAELARLTLVDTNFRSGGSVGSFGLAPVDVVWQPAIGRAILLAYPGGMAALYRVTIGASPQLEVIWRGQGQRYSRIVATGNFDRDSTQEVAIIGDSSFAIVGIDGNMRMRIAAPMIDAYPVTSAAEQFVILTRDGSNVTVSILDASSHRVLDRRSLRLPGKVLSLYRTSKSFVLALASDRQPGTAYLVDLARRLEVTSIPMSRPVFALVGFEADRHHAVAALVRDYPTPRLVPLIAGSEVVDIDYPLTTVFESVASTLNYHALIASDSVALYTSEWKLIDAVASPGTDAPRLTEIGPNAMLLATGSGSRRIAVDATGPSWLSRNWRILMGVTAVLLALGAIVAFIARISHVQSIYFNLVGVPSSHGVIVLSRTQRVTQMNPSARNLLGISSYIPLDRHIGEYLTRDELRGVVAALRGLFIDGESFEQRLDIESGDSSRAITFRGRTMLTRAGFRAGYLLLVEDVTSTIAQERLVNWASVAHHIAHEMKTPLGTVRMTAEMLRERLTANGRDEDYLRATTRILKQSERLREIVDDLLTVARTESLQRTRADFSLLIASLANDYRDYLPPNVELEVTISGEDYRCNIDVQQVTVAIRNLLDNARHAIGGRESGRITVAVASTEREMTLVVADNGIGMRDETLSRLFQPFYSEREGGSGIGTVIIKRVFEAHGGSVDVTSAPGEGTRFVIKVPRD